MSLQQIDLRDPKGELQELMQGRGLALPVYSVLEVDGPDHAPVYKVESSVQIRDDSAMKPRKLFATVTVVQLNVQSSPLRNFYWRNYVP